jgi:hypothetical protein
MPPVARPVAVVLVALLAVLGVGCGDGWTDGVIDDINGTGSCSELIEFGKANLMHDDASENPNVSSGELSRAAAAFDRRAEELGCGDLGEFPDFLELPGVGRVSSPPD